MKLKEHETDLVGKEFFVENRVVGDEVCERIEFLISHDLERIASDWSGWDVLYRDPTDGRFWELTYPEGYLHGGGPPRLKCIPRDEAIAKYGDIPPPESK